MNKLRHYIVLSLLLVCWINGVSQDKGMYLYGRTLELNLLDSSESKVGQIPLSVFIGDSLFLETESSTSGKYSCFLPFGAIYIVQYGEAPFVPKRIEFDLTNVGGKTVRKGFSLDLDMSVFRSEDALLTLIHTEPVARAAYSKKPDLIVFDPSYSSQHGAGVRKAILVLRQNSR
jgi:hypothetical protein